ncbi:MAG: zinc-binding dehydrogenase [Pseudomonadota bacterium]
MVGSTSNFWQFEAYGLPEDVLEQATIELPAPGAGQALVSIRAIGLNRSEFNYVQGRYMPAPAFPSCLGQEAVGEVVALGEPDPENPAPLGPLKVGQRVALLPGRMDMAGMGSYRDVGLYEQSALAPVPESYSDAEGAALWMAVLTMGGALELAGVSADNAAGKIVLLTAASSSMGVVALKLLRAWGATSIATTRDAAKASVLAELADEALVCADAESLASGVQAAGGGFDVALDPVGQAFYPGLLESASTGATIVSYEMISGREPLMPIPLVMMKDLALKGFTIFRVYRRPGLLDALLEVGMEHAESIRPLIADRFPLSEAPRAVAAMGRAEHVGKIVLDV